MVGAQDDGADEDLPQPPSGRANTRLWIGVGLAVVAFVGVVVARAASSPDTAPQAGKTPTVTPSSSFRIEPGPTPTGPVTAPPLLYNGIVPSAETTRTELPSDIPTRRGHDPQKCPGLRCSASPALPGSVRAAIRSAFPESTIERSVTVRLRGHHHVLWYREVDVQVASEFLTLRVEAPARGQRTGAGSHGGHDLVTTFADGALGPWHVSVEVVDRLGGRPDLAPLMTLAADARIVTG